MTAWMRPPDLLWKLEINYPSKARLVRAKAIPCNCAENPHFSRNRTREKWGTRVRAVSVLERNYFYGDCDY